MSNNRVEVHVGAKTSELKKGMNEAENIVKDTAQEIEGIGKKVDFQIDVSGVQKTFDNLSSNISTQMLSLGKKIAAGLGSAIAIDGLMDLTKNAIMTASEVQKMSDMLGESVEDFQYFAKGAQTAGLSLEQFGMMGKDALDRLGEARRGEGEMMDFFEKVAPKIGVTIDMFKDLSGPEVLQKYYDVLEATNTPHAEVVSYMEQIADNSTLLIPLLKDGGEGFKYWGEQAKNAGAVMSKDMVANLDKAKQNLYTLELQFQGFQVMLINSVTPAVIAIAQNFDNIKAVVTALGAAIAAKLVVQCAVLSKEFVIGIAQGIAYQVQLSALQGQALRTATAMGVLRGASALLGGPVGLGMLAVQGIAAGAAFLYMKRSSDEAVPTLNTQGKTIAELRIEYEKLDKAQQRVLVRQATTDLSTAEQGFRKQELALLGLIRVVIKHSEASDADKKAAKELYDQYNQGTIDVDQLANGINKLQTVEKKHKNSIDETAAAATKENKVVIEAQGVLKTYNQIVNQGTKDNKSHTNSINDKANALSNLTAKQMEYVQEAQKQSDRERYITTNMKKLGIGRERAENMADARDKAGMGYNVKDGAMPGAVKQAEEADWKLKQAAKAREESEKKTAKSGSGAKSKYDPTSYSDLRIKSQEAYAGGKAHQAVLDLAAKIQDSFKITRFTAFNDKYHQGTNSKHAKGLALDFSLQDPAKSAQVSGDLRSMLAKNGVKGQVLDEYKNPSKRATGGHIHVSFDSQSDADKYLGLTKAGNAKNAKKSSSDTQYESWVNDQTRKAEDAEKNKVALQYKYANERKKIATDLQNELDDIEKSTLSSNEKKNFKVKAEQEAADKIKAIHIEDLEHRLELNEQEIAGRELLADRIYDLEIAQLQALFDAGKISNVDRVNLEKELQDKLTATKRVGLEERLGLEIQLGKLTGDSKGIAAATNNLGALDHQKSINDIQNPGMISDAEIADFEEKFGDLTSRISGLWDKGIQSMMNGTLTWKNAMNAIFTELAGAFIQSMVTAPLKQYAASLATRLAVKFGFIKAEVAAEAVGQAAQTGAVVAGETAKTAATGVGVFARIGMKIMETIKSVMMSAWEAMAKTMASIPFPLNIALGAAAFAGVAGIVSKVASARSGYDIPAGVNPVTQLHEEEMVLPKQHANTIRALGKSLSSDGGIGGGGQDSQPQNINHFSIQAWDSKDVRQFFEKHGRELANGLKGYNRNFGR